MKATLKAKLGEDMEDSSFWAPATRLIGSPSSERGPSDRLLLPCNVVVRADREPDRDTCIVEAMNPQILVEVTGEPALRDIADEVHAKNAGRHRLTATAATSA